MAENAEQPQGVSFHDYHRTIIGYHGTTAEVAERLVNGDAFESSDNDDDWFGTGIYFWEYAPKQAWWWAAEFKRYEQPAVVGAVIRLGHCFDLLDPVNVTTLKDFHAHAVARWQASRVEIPKNGNQHKKLDCAIFNLLYDVQEKPPIETARAVYVCQPVRQSGSGPGVGFMSKPIFKSVSGCRRTSSRSGGSVVTVTTAGNPGNNKMLASGKYGPAVKQIRGMSRTQFKKTLVRLGISRPDGKLTAKYSTAKK